MMLPHFRYKKQRGVAIVLALGVITMAALAATAIIVSQSTWARRIELSHDHTQAQLLIQTGLNWARAVLSDDLLVSNSDHGGEPWALVLPAIPVDEGSLLGHIEEQQGRFNVNNLLLDGSIDAAWLASFRRLLVMLKLPPELAATLADWLDADNQARPGGAEDEYYQALPAPYLSANRGMIDLAELADVAGFTDLVRNRLRPYITALPGTTPINANTAAPEVLAAVIEGLGLDAARVLDARRKRAWFRDYADFVSQLPPALQVSGSLLTADNFGVRSDFFIASAQVSHGSAQANGSALLMRTAVGWPRVIWRKYP